MSTPRCIPHIPGVHSADPPLPSSSRQPASLSSRTDPASPRHVPQHRPRTNPPLPSLGLTATFAELAGASSQGQGPGALRARRRSRSWAAGPSRRPKNGNLARKAVAAADAPHRPADSRETPGRRGGSGGCAGPEGGRPAGGRGCRPLAAVALGSARCRGPAAVRGAPERSARAPPATPRAGLALLTQGLSKLSSHAQLSLSPSLCATAPCQPKVLDG